jgi:hypothetical protein
VSSISGTGTVTSATSSTITSFPTLSGLYNSTSEYRARVPCSPLVPIGTNGATFHANRDPTLSLRPAFFLE